MASALVSGLLKKYLGDFLEGLDVDISVLSGTVEQKNVRFRPEALHNLNLPVTVKAGVVGSLTVKVPLTALSSEPTVIVLNEVYVLAVPKRNLYDDQFEARAQETKMRRLQIAEAMTSEQPAEKAGNAPGFFASRGIQFAELMINNLQVRLRNVHIRYEDATDPNNCFAAGVTLESLVADTADINWLLAKVTEVSDIMRKLVELKNLAVYWDSPGTPLTFNSIDDLKELLRTLIHRDTPSGMLMQEHQYILMPVSGSARLSINKAIEKNGLPQVDMRFSFSDILVAANENQYKNILYMVDHLTGEIRGLKYRKMRPAQQPEEAPRKWWKFAIEAVVNDRRHARELWSWRKMEEFSHDMRDYIQIWFVKLQHNRKKGTLKRLGLTRLRKRKGEILRRCSFEQIMYFRALATMLYELKQEEVKTKMESTSVFKRGKEKASIMALDVTALSRSEWLELKAMLHRRLWHKEEVDIVHPMPAAYVRNKFTFGIQRLTVELRGRPLGHTLMCEPLATLEFSRAQASVLQRDTSSSVEATLSSLDMFDWVTLHGEKLVAICPSVAAKDVDLITVKVDVNPENEFADKVVTVDAKALDMVFSVDLVQAVHGFLTSTDSALLSNLIESREETMQDLVKRAQYQLRHALQNNNILDLRVNIEAPFIIVPENCRDPNSNRIVAALGHISMHTDLKNAKKQKEAAEQKRKNKRRSAPADMSLAYDQYVVEVQDMKAVMTGGSDWKKKESQTHILDETSLRFELSVLNIATTQLARVKIAAHFPEPPRLYASSHVIVGIARMVNGVLGNQFVQERIVEARELQEQKSRLVQLARKSAAKQAVSTEDGKITNIPQATLSFAMPAFTATLDRQDGGQFVVVRLMELNVAVQVNEENTELSLRMRGLEIDDLINEYGDDFARLASSTRATSEAGKALSDTDLIEVKLRQTPRASALWDSVRVENDLELNVSHLRVEVNRETCFHLARFAADVRQQISAVGLTELPKAAVSQVAGEQGSEREYSLRLKASLQSFALSMNRAGRRFLLLRLGGSAVEVKRAVDGNAAVAVKVGAISIIDQSKESRWQRIAHTTGDHTVEIDVATFDSKLASYPGHDVQLTVKVYTIKLAIVTRVFKDVAGYFQELEQMKQFLAEGAEAAAKKVMRARDKILLSVDVDNPYVYFPISDDADELFVADLGRISVTSSFPEREGIVFNDFVVQVQNLNLRSGLRSEPQNDKFVLQNTDVGLKILKSLVALEDRGRAPDVFIVVKADDGLALQLDEEQVGMVFDALVENVAAPTVWQVAEKKGKESAVSLHDENEDENEIEDEQAGLLEAKKHSKVSDVCTNDSDDGDDMDPSWMDVDVSVSRLQLSVIRGGFTPEASFPTALLSCDGIRLHVDVPGPSEVALDMTIAGVRLEDSREEAEQSRFRNLLQPVVADSQEEYQFFAFQFRQQAGHFDDCGVRVGRVRFVVEPGWLLALFNFLFPFLDRLLSTIDAFYERGMLVRKPRNGMHLLLTCDRPELTIVEDTLNAESRALVANTLFTMEYTEDNKMNKAFDMSFLHLEAYKTRMGTMQRATILAPSKVVMAYEEQPETVQSIGVQVMPLNLLLTYQDLLLIIGIAKQWQVWVLDESDDADELKEEPLSEDFAEYAVAPSPKDSGERDGAKTNDNNNSNNNDEEDAADVVSSSATMEEVVSVRIKEAPATRKRTQKFVLPDRWAKTKPPDAQGLSIHLHGIRCRVIDDLHGHVHPILRLLVAEGTVQLSNWKNDHQFKVVTLVSCIADYYNEDSQAWEPMLRGLEEPTREKVSCSEGMWEVELSMHQNRGTQKLHLLAMASKTLSLTVSRAFVPTAIRFVEAWKESQQQSDAHRAERAVSDPYLIVNQTGAEVRCYVAGENAPIVLAASGEDATKALPVADSSFGRLHDGMSAEKHRLDLEIEGAQFPLTELPIDQTCSYAMGLGTGLTAVFEVRRLKNGTRRVTIRSNVQIRNLSDHAVYYRASAKGAPTMIAPGESHGVAFELLHCAVRFCPDTDKYEWSRQAVTPATLLQRTPLVGTKRVFQQHVVCQNSMGGSQIPWIWAVQVEGAPDMLRVNSWSWTITFRAPIKFRNLLHTDMDYALWDISNPKEAVQLFSGSAAKGEESQLFRIREEGVLAVSIQLPNFKFSSAMRITGENPATQSRDGKISLDYLLESGSRTVSFYTSYWLLNTTGLPILFRNPEVAEKEFKFPINHEGEADPEPFLYWEPRIAFRIADSEWSEPLRLAKHPGVGQLSVKAEQGTQLYKIGVQVFDAPQEFWRTKIVQLSNRYYVVNRTGKSLRIGQCETGHDFVLREGEQVAFHWGNGTPLHKKMRVTFLEGEGWAWSGGFELKEVDVLELRIRRRGRARYGRLVVQMTTEGPTTAVIFHSAKGRPPMYLVRNRTPCALIVKQHGVYDEGIQVAPGTTAPFSWVEPAARDASGKLLREVELQPAPHSAFALLGKSQSAAVTYSLDEVAKLRSFSLKHPQRKEASTFAAEVYLQGATKVLVLEAEGQILLEEDFEVVAGNSQMLSLSLSLPGVSLSVVSGKPAEIARVELGQITVELERDALEQTLEVNVNSCQVDSQLYDGVFDTVLCSQAVPKRPFFHLSVNTSVNSNYKNITFLNAVEVLMQQVTISLDEAFLTHMVATVYDLIEYVDRSMHQSIVRPVKDYTNYELELSDMIYARLLLVGPIKAIISFRSCPWAAASLEGDMVERILNLAGPFVGLENATFKLNSLRLDNPFTTKENLKSIVAKHYANTAIRKAYLLLGSLSTFGAPIQLIENVGTGMWDLWYEPAQALHHAPKEFGEGLRRGTMSMISKTVYGIFKSASDITGSLGNVTAQLSFDPDYKEARERSRQKQARHAGEGLWFGARDFGVGLFKGITGIVTNPVRGAQQEGAVGLAKGIGRGLAGVVVKPVAGVFGMASRITEGVKNQANMTQIAHRLRSPRHIGRTGIIREYSGYSAEGQELLYMLEEGRFADQFYLFHFPHLHSFEEPKAKKAVLRRFRVLVSNKNLFYIKGTSAAKLHCVFQILLREILNISMSDTGLVVERKSKPVQSFRLPGFYPYELRYVYFKVRQLWQRETAQKLQNSLAPISLRRSDSSHAALQQELPAESALKFRVSRLHAPRECLHAWAETREVEVLERATGGHEANEFQLMSGRLILAESATYCLAVESVKNGGKLTLAVIDGAKDEQQTWVYSVGSAGTRILLAANRKFCVHVWRNRENGVERPILYTVAEKYREAQLWRIESTDMDDFVLVTPFKAGAFRASGRVESTGSLSVTGFIDLSPSKRDSQRERISTSINNSEADSAPIPSSPSVSAYASASADAAASSSASDEQRKGKDERDDDDDNDFVVL